MQDEYRVRDTKTVQLTYDQLHDLGDVKSTLVDIDGELVEFYVDGFDTMHDDEADTTLGLSPQAIDRMMSGFVCQFFSVLRDGELGLILMAEDRIDHEIAMEEKAGGFIEEHIAKPDVTLDDIRESENFSLIGEDDYEVSIEEEVTYSDQEVTVDEYATTGDTN